MKSRVVVCLPSWHDDVWTLPPSDVVDSTEVSGGVRSLMELAVAAAATGRRVELRGEVWRTDLSSLADAAGACPIVDLPAREPVAGDTVILPEGIRGVMPYARAALSPSRNVLLMLAPPGLWGWAFGERELEPGVSLPAREDVGRPEHFRAIASLGFELWTNSGPLAGSCLAAGVPCTDIGVGWPRFPDMPAAKTHDVVYLEHNRWVFAAQSIASKLKVDCLRIPHLPHDELMATLGSGKILLWPSTLEGWARIQCEARAVGTVPVALSDNPYAVGLDSRHGAVVVGSPEEMAKATMDLLSDPGRLAGLAAVARQSAAAQVDWAGYVRRVDEALSNAAYEPPGKKAFVQIRELLRKSDGKSGGDGAEPGTVPAARSRGRDPLRSEALRSIVLRERLARGGMVEGFARRSSQTAAARLAGRVGRGVRRMRSTWPCVLTVPGTLDDANYAMRQVLQTAGATLHDLPRRGQLYDLVLGWYDMNWTRTPGIVRRPPDVDAAIAAVVGRTCARAYWNCLPGVDISKTRVAWVFEHCFSRMLTLDPRTHRGMAVEKSDENARHDGRLVECPLQPRRGMVYQRFIVDSRHMLWRVVFMGGEPCVVIARTLDPDGVFAQKGRSSELASLGDLACEADRFRLARMASLMRLDYCEMDVLKDDEGRIWVVDITATPTLSERTTPLAAIRERIIAAQADELLRRLSRHWPRHRN